MVSMNYSDGEEIGWRGGGRCEEIVTTVLTIGVDLGSLEGFLGSPDRRLGAR